MIPTRGTGLLIDPTTPDGAQPVGTSSGDWQLIMSEEFNGAKELIDGPRGYIRFRPDGPKWTDRYSDGWYSAESANGRDSVGPRLHIPLERQYYTHEAITVADSAVKFTATRDFAYGEEYTSGMVTSADFYNQQFGFVEARIKLPIATQAIWPAFWMQPDFKRPDPMDPALWEVDTHYLREVDILETFMDNIAKAALLYPQTGTQVVLGDTGNEWHTYGFEWDMTKSVVYYDGEVKVNSSAFIYEYPMYLLLNFALRDTGNPSPLVMETDYIRCWRAANAQF